MSQPARLRRRFVAALATLLVLTSGTVALADEIYNNVDATIDATAETLNLSVGASATTVTFRVSQANGDGKQGCNLTGSTTAGFSVASSNPATATVSPSSLTFTSCGDSRTIQVTPGTAGTSTITLTQTGNNTGGSFDTAPATFTVNVTSACTPAPAAPSVVASHSPAPSGWYNAGSAAAAFTVSPGANAEYSFDGGTTWLAYSGEVVLGDGTTSVVARNFRPASPGCARLDGPASSPAVEFKVDTAPPTLGLAVSPDANLAGWNNSTVTVDWTCGDNAGGSGIDATTCPSDASLGHGTDLAAADFSVSDIAGNTSTLVNRRAVKVDTVAPVLSVAVTPEANGAGWNNSLVGADWSCSDALSGIDPTTPCPDDETLGEGTTPQRSVTVFDVAGNQAGPVLRREVKVDVTQPSASVVVDPDANAAGWNRTTVTATYTCADGGSGLATACPSTETFSAEGSYPAQTFSVTDNAGNTSATGSRRLVKIDKTDPTVTVSLRDGDGNPIAANGNGWFNQAVTVHFACADPLSGGVASGVASCPDDYTISADGIHAAAPYSAADVAGNSTAGETPVIRIDTTAPVLSLAISPAANGAGWNKTAVTETWTCTDDGSGIAESACPADHTYGNGTNIPAASFSFADLAGNTSNGVERRAVKVDTVAPTLGLSVTPDANTAGWNNTDVTVDWACADNSGGSGIDATTCPADDTLGDGVDMVAASYSVSDVAGNASPLVERRAIKIDETAPVLTVTVDPALPNGSGWNNTQVSADWTCSDTTGGSGIDAATPCPVDELFNEGTFTERSVTVRDVAGNATGPVVRRAVKVDLTQPGAGVVVQPDANLAGWNNTDVTATYSCADGGGSGIAFGACPTNESFSAEGSYPAKTFAVADNAGNVSPTGTRRAVKIDKTAPTATVILRAGAGGAEIAPNANGWFNQNVFVDFECSDPTSGGVSSGIASCPSDYTLDSDGTHDAAGFTVIDVAGNTTPGTTPVIRIDKTAPVNQVTGVADGATYVVGSVPAAGCSTTDGGSGVATSATLSVTGGNPAGVGTFTASCSGGTDRAGNSAATASVSYTVGYTFAGFFQPINDPAGSSPSVFKQGSTIAVKFALLDSAGQRVSDAVGQAIAAACDARLTWARSAASSGAVSEAVSSNPANDGNCFRYDPTADQFIFNLGTKNMAVGGWQLTATVTAGSATVAIHSVSVTLR